MAIKLDQTAEITYPLADSPRWMEGLRFEKALATEEVIITVAKRSGDDYGYLALTRGQINRILDALEIKDDE